MQTSRASTRRAALAAFLLFAAGLFVVGPAEASRTTDPHSSLTPLSAPSLASSSTHELASLELALLESVALAEPIAPVESSSRLGFAEDLSLLDVEARPCGFELFGGVGTRRCALTYARNNPVTNTDPTGLVSENGRVIADAGVTAADPGAESARRAELELRMMRLRSASQSAASSFGQRLLGAFTNNQLPAMYQARADKACSEADYIPCAIDLFGARVLPRNYLGPEGVLLIGSLFLPAARFAEGPAIVFGHGGRHLLGTAISEAAAEQAIRAQIADQVGRATLSGSFWGRVSIGGTTLTYRAYTLSDGTINVGTYYPGR